MKILENGGPYRYIYLVSTTYIVISDLFSNEIIII
jgi:hypothetical protein